VALYHPHGTLAQLGPPERLLGAPADDYVAGFVGFDRGIRRLSFFRTDGLSLSAGPVLPATATVASAVKTGEPWILVVAGEADLTPRGWVSAERLAGLDGDTRLANVATDGFGHTFTVGDDSLRAALDAAVLSPAGVAIGVDGDGRVVGVATFDQLRAAVQAAQAAQDALDAQDVLDAQAAQQGQSPGASR
jgi:osmoprotectant transport system ATP-binding protein